MWRRLLVTSSLMLWGGGCAVAPAAAPGMTGLWQDEAFAYAASLVTVSQATLFDLDAEIVPSLPVPPGSLSDPEARIASLLRLVFGADMKSFVYEGGHSTVASETWQRKRGDCLSLSIMSLALARSLGVPAHVQEVRVPTSFDRRGGIDFVNAHVNLRVRNTHPVQLQNRVLPAADLIVDFEPQVGSQQRGRPLSDAAMYARFLNNRAAEHLAQQRERLAYAHFKAAILAEPLYPASYSNLAQLYLRAGSEMQAEALLLRALSLGDPSGVALDSLHRLMLAQGRHAEAKRYETQLATRRNEDPYYWLGLGLDHLRHARHPQAVKALERALAMTTGFTEVHHYLAIAYWRNGQAVKAHDQVALLATLDEGSGSAAQLLRKFQPQDATLMAR